MMVYIYSTWYAFIHLPGSPTTVVLSWTAFVVFALAPALTVCLQTPLEIAADARGPRLTGHLCRHRQCDATNDLAHARGGDDFTLNNLAIKGDGSHGQLAGVFTLQLAQNKTAQVCAVQYTTKHTDQVSSSLHASHTWASQPVGVKIDCAMRLGHTHTQSSPTQRFVFIIIAYVRWNYNMAIVWKLLPNRHLK